MTPKRDDGRDGREVPTARLALAVGAVAITSAIGALVLGEYEFSGWMPWLAGPLFGLVAGEVAGAVARTRHIVLTVATAVCAAGGIWWAGWISSGSGLEPVPWQVYLSAALAAATGALRSGPESGQRGPA